MSRRAPILAAVIGLALSVAAFFLLVFPKMREVGQVREELEAAQNDEVVLRSQLARLEEAKENAPRLLRQLARVRRQIPPVSDLPGIINLLQDAADISKVDFFSVSPGTPTSAFPGPASEIPAQVQVIGGFFQVDEFLYRLETLPRAAKVVNLQVGAGPNQLPQIQITMDVRFFTTDTTTGPGAPVEAAPAQTDQGGSPATGASSSEAEGA